MSSKDKARRDLALTYTAALKWSLKKLPFSISMFVHERELKMTNCAIIVVYIRRLDGNGTIKKYLYELSLTNPIIKKPNEYFSFVSVVIKCTKCCFITQWHFMDDLLLRYDGRNDRQLTTCLKQCTTRILVSLSTFLLPYLTTIKL